MTLLAIEGGGGAVPPAYQKFVHPKIDDHVLSELSAQARSALSLYSYEGIYETFETALSHEFGCPHALTVNSGTSALFSLYYGAGIGPGDEVVVPSYTFFATIMPLLALGASLRFADCTATGNVDPEAVAQAVTAKTKAIVVVHLWGIPCEMDKLREIAQRSGALLLEDASHAHGATFAGHPVGSQSDGAAWSLQGKKILTTGEGGFLGTHRTEVFERAVLLGHFNKRARQQVQNPELAKFATTGAGFNLRMHPLAARLGVQQIKMLPEMVRDRRRSAEVVNAAVVQIEGLSAAPVPDQADPSWYAIPILYDEEAFGGVSLSRFVEALNAEGALEIDSPGSTTDMSRHEAMRVPGSLWRQYNDRQAHVHIADGDFRVARNVNRHLLKLPSWYGDEWEGFAHHYCQALRKVSDARGRLKT